MQKKNFYSIFLMIALPTCVIANIVCAMLKINSEVYIYINGSFCFLILGAFLINVFILEPKIKYNLTKNKVKNSGNNDDSVEFLAEKLLKDSKFKRLFITWKIFLPIYIVPFSIIVGNIVNNYSNCSEEYLTYFISFLFALFIYSVYSWYTRYWKIQDYIKNKIFEYYADKYQMEKIPNDDELTNEAVKSVREINSKFDTFSLTNLYIQRQITSSAYENIGIYISNLYKDKLLEKRFFLLGLYQIVSQRGLTFWRNIFEGICMIIPDAKKNLFYKKQDYNNETYSFDETYINNISESNINSELKTKLEQIKYKYNKEFKIYATNKNIKIICEQNLTISARYSWMKIYLLDYCNAINYLFELSKEIEIYL